MSPTRVSNRPTRPLANLSHVLITGADGMLAYDLRKSFLDFFPEAVITSLSKKELDITSKDSIVRALETYQPQWVLNAAAFTAVDQAEQQREQARLLNALSPRYLADACGKAGVQLVHFGTDQVFDGESSRPRAETDKANPCNWYAETKLEGELAVLEDPRNLVLRVQWLYGYKKDRFTVLRDKKQFSPFADQWGCPTWARDVADDLSRLVGTGATGLYHYSYDDFATWADVFEFVKKHWGLGVELNPKKTEELALPARRPAFSVLSNTKLKAALGIPTMGSWKIAMREFLDLVQSRRR